MGEFVNEKLQIKRGKRKGRTEDGTREGKDGREWYFKGEGRREERKGKDGRKCGWSRVGGGLRGRT